MTKKEEGLEFRGTIVAALGGDKFEVELDGSNHKVIAYISGKMRTKYIVVVPGDKVKVEVSPYDPTRGRIVFREKK